MDTKELRAEIAFQLKGFERELKRIASIVDVNMNGYKLQGHRLLDILEHLRSSKQHLMEITYKMDDDD